MSLEDAKARIAELEAELAARDARLVGLEAELAGKDEHIAKLEAVVSALRKQVAVLKRNSKNSNLPPSSDPPGKPKDNEDERKRKRKRGGQPGHPGKHRELLPLEKVNEVVDFFPSHCGKCRKSLPQCYDRDPRRSQVIEIPPVEPHVTEYRLHEVECPCCKHHTLAAHDADKIPASPFGPRLAATIGLLTGVHHLSRRAAQQLLSDLAGVKISLGGLSRVEARVANAVEPAVDEAWQQVREDPVKHTDGTTWLQAGTLLSLWTVATAMTTVFKIVANGRKQTLQPLYGELKGILISDRATALNFWAMGRRQICWAHLLRKFVSFSERDGPAGAIGRNLLGYTGLVFEYWHDYKDKKLSQQQFQKWMAPLREQFEAELRSAVKAGIPDLSGSCANMLEHQPALWTFTDHDGVEPTNNHAERELRAFVLWRKRSFGTQSERGNIFAERLMTVAHTLRKRGRNVLDFLTACCEAHAARGAAPSLPSPVQNVT